jgi:DnaJ-class molecular chaperone
MNTESRQNYYEILDISENASAQEIYNAYQKAKMTYCHDSKAVLAAFSPEEAAELRNLIEEAYQVLSNVDYRNVYEKRVMSNAYEAQDLTAEAIKIASEDLFQKVQPPIIESEPEKEVLNTTAAVTPHAPVSLPAAVTETAAAVAIEETAPVLNAGFEKMMDDKKECSGEYMKQFR